jgi:hypothetical protein
VHRIEPAFPVTRIEIVPKNVPSVCLLPKRFYFRFADGAVSAEYDDILRSSLSSVSATSYTSATGPNGHNISSGRVPSLG